MTELWLKYIDEKGEEIRLPVEREKFSIGRHSENDLSIINPAISRQHAKIERFADVFVISDVGSSLGTKINGDELIEPTTLYNGDKINLGDSLEIEVEMISDNSQTNTAENAGANSEKSGDEDKSAGNSASASVAAISNASGGSSIPTSFFYIAPLLGIVVLLTLGGIFLATSGGKGKEESKGNEFVYSNERKTSTEPTPEVNESIAEETPSPAQTNENTTVNTTDTPAVSAPEENNSQPSPQISSELGKIEVNSASFLRRIAQNEPRAFLTGKQQEFVQGKINQFKNSAALADNLKSAKKNAAAIQSLASSKNLKAQFLTVAALARLGNNRGDVLQTAQSMAEILDELTRNIGDERSDDALLVIAAYEQGASGNALGLRNKLQGLVNESPSSSRQIRTIWFLKNSNHITEAEFESALRFLAIGTISQNPKEFGVNAEAVIF